MISNTKNKKTHKGFTLIEVLVTVSIASILLSIAVPSFTKMIKSNRITSATNELVSSLILTRSEALKRNDNISLCASTNQTSCTQGSEFADGWIIFQDCDRDGVYDTVANNTDCANSAAETIIKVHDKLHDISIIASDNRSFLLYRFTGRSNTVTLEVREKGNTAVRKSVLINRTGRVRSQ